MSMDQPHGARGGPGDVPINPTLKKQKRSWRIYTARLQIGQWPRGQASAQNVIEIFLKI